MTSFASTVLSLLHAEATPSTVNTLLARDLLIEAETLASHRSLDVIALEALFVARLDGAKRLHEAYEAGRRQLFAARTTVVLHEDPAGELADKIGRLQRAAFMNTRAEAESTLRALINKTRKAFPGLGIKVETIQGRLHVATDLKIRSNGMAVTFGSAGDGEIGNLLVKCEQGLADWAWLQTDRLKRLEVLVVHRGQKYLPIKRRGSSARRRNSARYERMSRQELRQAA